MRGMTGTLNEMRNADTARAPAEGSPLNEPPAAPDKHTVT